MYHNEIKGPKQQGMDSVKGSSKLKLTCYNFNQAKCLQQHWHNTAIFKKKKILVNVFI